MSDSLVVRLAHDVRAEHASTGRGISPLSAVFEDGAPPGWHLEIKGEHVVVTARDGIDPPAAAPVIVLTVTDPMVAMRLAQPSVRVTLDQPEIVRQFDPVPMTLTVDLVADDGTASTGKTVRARGSAGAPVALPEVATEPGTYRSAARLWRSTFNPLDVAVDGTSVRTLAIDFTRKDTRVRVVDTT